jgi:hypothetical protein
MVKGRFETGEWFLLPFQEAVKKTNQLHEKNKKDVAHEGRM